MDNFEYCN